MTRVLRLTAATLVALLAAGCSGGGGSGSASASSSANAGDMAVKYTQCLRRHGVDVADPQPGQPITIKGAPGDASSIQQAQEACKAYAPQQEGSGPQSGADMDWQAALVACLRQKGVTVADPQAGQPLRIQSRKQDEAQTQQAVRDCQAKVGAPSAAPAG